MKGGCISACLPSTRHDGQVEYGFTRHMIRSFLRITFYGTGVLAGKDCCRMIFIRNGIVGAARMGSIVVHNFSNKAELKFLYCKLIKYHRDFLEIGGI